MNEELFHVFTECCALKDVVGYLRLEEDGCMITLESTEANYRAEKKFYETMLKYGVSADCTSVQFLLRGDGSISLAFDAFKLSVAENATIKLRLQKPSSDILETLLEYARRMGPIPVNVDTEKIARGESKTIMLCFSINEDRVLTVSSAARGDIRNFVLENADEGMYLSVPYNWSEFEKEVKENGYLPLCDVASIDVTNLSFTKGVLPTNKRPVIVKQDADQGGLKEVFVVGGQV